MMNIGIQFKYIHCAKKLKEMRGKKHWQEGSLNEEGSMK